MSGSWFLVRVPGEPGWRWPVCTGNDGRPVKLAQCPSHLHQSLFLSVCRQSHQDRPVVGSRRRLFSLQMAAIYRLICEINSHALGNHFDNVIVFSSADSGIGPILTQLCRLYCSSASTWSFELEISLSFSESFSFKPATSFHS